jgi:hypothetical protein
VTSGGDDDYRIMAAEFRGMSNYGAGSDKLDTAGAASTRRKLSQLFAFHSELFDVAIIFGSFHIESASYGKE